MELVGILHRDTSESVEILLEDGFRDDFHAFGDDVFDAMLKESGGLDGSLHARGGACPLFVVGNDADESLDLWPVGLGSDFDGERVTTVRGGAHLPSDVASEE